MVFQVMQLSDKSCELAEENDRLFDKNKEQMRRIELLETEQSELVKKLDHFNFVLRSCFANR